MMDARSYENRDGLQDFDEGMGHVFNSLVFIDKRVDASIGDYQLTVSKQSARGYCRAKVIVIEVG